jgi:hypothetical protein
LIFILLPLSALGEETPPSKAPTQTDLIIGLVDSLGWSFGLPDEPKIDDYITILKGRRTWRFEIEDIYVPSAKAPLAPKEIRSFGSFSGKLWQRAPARVIEADLTFLLPIPGSYEIKAALTKPGYVFKIDDTELTADGERNFSEVSFGKTDLPSGVHEAKITIPSRGGIDYLLLLAPPVQAIEPTNGWEPDNELTSSDLAVVVSRVLKLQPFLAPQTEEIVIEAEDAPAPKDAKLSKDRYQGPVQGEWLKAGMRAVAYSHLFEISEAGIFDLSLNILAKVPVVGLVNGKNHFKIKPKPYFTTVSAGSFFFEKGVNQIDIDLPSRSGLDRFILKPRNSSPEDFLRLTGLSHEGTPTTDQLDQILRLIATIGAQR